MRLKFPSGRAAARGGKKLRGLLLGVAVTCVILVLLLGSVVALAPVSVLTRKADMGPAVVAVYGSLRAGRVELAGGYRLTWNSRLAVLGVPHLVTGFVLEGTDTRITGDIDTGLAGIRARDVSGRAGPGLTQLVPGAWACEMSARVADVSFGWGWRRASASGSVNTPEGTCTKGEQSIAMPPLALLLSNEQRDAVLSLTDGEQTSLARVAIRRERLLDITVEPAAAAIFPQLPRSGPILLTLPF